MAFGQTYPGLPHSRNFHRRRRPTISTSLGRVLTPARFVSDGRCFYHFGHRLRCLRELLVAGQEKRGTLVSRRWSIPSGASLDWNGKDGESLKERYLVSSSHSRTLNHGIDISPPAGCPLVIYQTALDYHTPYTWPQHGICRFRPCLLPLYRRCRASPLLAADLHDKGPLPLRFGYMLTQCPPRPRVPSDGLKLPLL